MDVPAATGYWHLKGSYLKRSGNIADYLPLNFYIWSIYVRVVILTGWDPLIRRHARITRSRIFCFYSPKQHYNININIALAEGCAIGAPDLPVATS